MDTSTAPARPRPLDGIRVLDFSQVVSGPICGRILADLGADVVKLEPPEGDIIRFLQPQVGDDPVSVYFTWVNAGKRSISLDLRTDRGVGLARQLAESSDVVLENFRPGALEQYGLDADTLLARKPELVYCSINGWGYDNAWSQRRAYAAMVQAEVGRVELDARLRNAPPEQSPHVDGDITPGLLAVGGIVAALFQRERTGLGQHLDVSMAEALVYTDEWTSTDLAGYDGHRIPDTWNYPIFTVADGTQVAFMGDPTGRLQEIAAALTDAPIAAAASRDEALQILADLCAQVPDFATLEARFDLFGFLVSEVRTVRALADTPWAHRARGLRRGGAGSACHRRAVPFRRRDDRGAGPGAPLRRAHARSPRRALWPLRRTARPPRGRRDHQVRLSAGRRPEMPVTRRTRSRRR